MLRLLMPVVPAARDATCVMTTLKLLSRENRTHLT